MSVGTYAMRESKGELQLIAGFGSVTASSEREGRRTDGSEGGAGGEHVGRKLGEAR